MRFKLLVIIEYSHNFLNQKIWACANLSGVVLSIDIVPEEVLSVLEVPDLDDTKS